MVKDFLTVQSCAFPLIILYLGECINAVFGLELACGNGWVEANFLYKEVSIMQFKWDIAFPLSLICEFFALWASELTDFW